MAVIVAVFVAFAALGLVAVSVDLGGMWSTQRELATSTDGAALAATTVLKDEISTSLDGCPDTGDEPVTSAPGGQLLRAMWDEAEEIIAENGSDQLVQMRVHCSEAAAKVEVVGTQRAVSTVGPAVGGEENPEVFGRTVAEYRIETTSDPGPQEPPEAPTVFEQLALCKSFVPADPDEWNGAEGIAVPYGASDEACEEAPGNWGWIDSPEACDQAERDWCDGTPGNNLPQEYFEDWLLSDHYQAFLLFDQAKGEGDNAEFKIAGWVEARFIGCVGGGNNCNGNPDQIILEIKATSLEPGDPDESDDPNHTETTTSDIAICEVAGGNQCQDQGW